MTIRERTEAIERETLSELACLAADSRGRAVEEEPCEVRTCFQRDRDRIIHACKSFRRLAYKTQCFIGGGQDHIRTRLTHTLEVSQIGRTVARALRLNEDLTEAIALGHDLGHTPFGHAGENALDKALKETGLGLRFEHHVQSLRVVDELEKDGRGVNLSFEVRNGVRYHRKRQQDLAPVMADSNLITLEGHIIKWADRIAYINHDLDDAIRAGITDISDVPRRILEVLGDRHSVRVNTCVADLVQSSTGQPVLRMSEPVCAAANELKHFLFARVYRTGGRAGPQERRAHAIVRQLFRCFMENPKDAQFMTPAQRRLPDEGRARVVADYVAGMTDRFACAQFAELYVPDGYL